MKSRKQHKRLNRKSILLPIVSIVFIGVAIILSTSYEKSWSFNWNGIRNHVKDTVEIVAFKGVIAYGPQDTVLIDQQKWIMNLATDTELLLLTDYPNGVIKAIAYEGLIRRPSFKGKARLILKAISDQKYPVYVRRGCAGTRKTIGEYLIHDVLDIDKSKPPISEIKPDFGLTDTEKHIILDTYKNHQSK